MAGARTRLVDVGLLLLLLLLLMLALSRGGFGLDCSLERLLATQKPR